MNSKLLLVKALTLLCLENQVPELTLDPSYDLCTEVTQKCKKKEGSVSDFGTDTTESLRGTLYWAINNKNTDNDILMQRLKLSLINDIPTYESIERGLTYTYKGEDVSSFLYTKAQNIRTDLKKNLARLNLIEAMEASAFKLRLGEEQVENYDAILPTLMQKIETTMSDTTEGIPGSVAEYDLDDPKQVAKALQHSRRSLSLDGVIRFSLQGFNNLFGANQGQRRGEFVLLSALQHKWKSGILRRCFIDACRWNKPFLFDEKKKPAALHISLENDAELDILEIYKDLWENEFGKPVDITSMTDLEIEEASEWVIAELSKNGIKPIIRRFNPANFDFAALKALIKLYEKKGYEIVFMSIDYLDKMSRAGLVSGGVTGSDLKDLYTRVFNLVGVKKIATITAHQMSTEAKQMERNGVDLLVKEVRELGYYENCRSLDQIVDMEIYQHKVTIGGRTYITWQRGKHRTPSITPEEMQFCIYEFNKGCGNFKPDIMGSPMYTHKFGSKATDGDLAGWDDFGMAA